MSLRNFFMKSLAALEAKNELIKSVMEKDLQCELSPKAFYVRIDLDHVKLFSFVGCQFDDFF